MTMPSWMTRGADGRLRVKRKYEPGNLDEVAVRFIDRAYTVTRPVLPVLVLGGLSGGAAVFLKENAITLLLDSPWSLPLVGAALVLLGAVAMVLVQRLSAL